MTEEAKLEANYKKFESIVELLLARYNNGEGISNKHLPQLKEDLKMWFRLLK